MEENGSPAPVFESDDERSSYLVRLSVHPEAIALKALSPEVTPEVAPEVAKLLNALKGEMSRRVLQEKIGLKDDEHFRKAYINPAISNGWIEMTLPDHPRSRHQKYRLTTAGKIIYETHLHRDTKN